MRVRILFLTVMTAFSMSAVAAEPPAPGANEKGKQLFRARCGGCHLAGGGGTLMLAKRLGKEKALLEERTDLLPLYIRTVVRHGVGSMPWFTRVELPDADLDAIADYLGKAGR
jgi:mono/diheme cytochrome c family protein